MKKTKRYLTQTELYKTFIKNGKWGGIHRVMRVLSNGKPITSMEIITKAFTTCPHKKMNLLREKGFNITHAKMCKDGLNRYQWIKK